MCLRCDLRDTALGAPPMAPMRRTIKKLNDALVNVSSGLGSLAQIGDPTSEFAAFRFIGYGASKAALNMLTVQLAAELKDSGIKVNSADPGYRAADLNGHRGRQTIPEGPAAAIRLALLPDDGPTGGFFSAGHPQPW